MLVLAPVALIGGEKNIREFCCFKATAEGTRVNVTLCISVVRINYS